MIAKLKVARPRTCVCDTKMELGKWTSILDQLGCHGARRHVKSACCCIKAERDETPRWKHENSSVYLESPVVLPLQSWL